MRTPCLCLLLAVAGCSSSSTPAGDSAAATGNANGTASSGSRLRARYAVSGDARQLVGFFDMQRQEECRFRPAEPGHIRCLPSDLIVAGNTGLGYSDPSCEVSVVAAPTTGCAAPSYVVTQHYDSATCTTGPFEIRKVLPATGPRYLIASDGSCGVAPASASSKSAGLGLGDAIAWTEFAEGEVTNVAGAPAALLISTSDGASATYGHHLDALGADCRFRVMSDGSARCVPDAQSGPLLYGDSICAQPVAVGYSNSTPLPVGCGGTSTSDAPPLWIADGSRAGDAYTDTLSCGGIVAVYKLGGENDGQRVYRSATPSAQNNGASCEMGDAYASSTRLLGDEISTSLPSASRVGSESGRVVSALVLATADDGTSVLVPGFHDTQLDLDCTFETASDGKLRCLPVAPSAQILFKDDTCSPGAAVAVLGPDCTRSGAKRYGRLTSATCPPATTVYALSDAPQDSPSGSALSGPAQCVKVSGINGGYDAAVADPAQFAEGQFSTE